MSREFPALEHGEALIDTADELLYRQITQQLFNEVERVPSMEAFGPARADQRRPSFARDSHPDVTPQSSRDWHQKNARSKSLGVWATSTADVAEVELRAVDDGNTPLEEGQVRAPGHCYVDYRGLTKAELKTAKGELLLRAINRGEFATVDSDASSSGKYP